MANCSTSAYQAALNSNQGGACSSAGENCTASSKLQGMPVTQPLPSKQQHPRGNKLQEFNICQEEFSTKPSVDLHQHVHSLKKKPYSCDSCPKTFSQRCHLSSHARSHSKERGTSRITCDVCQLECRNKSQFDVHYRIHTGTKPYTCDFCQKRFTQSSSLKVHLRLHTGEMPHTCDLCSKAFAQKSSLDWHLHTHAEKKKTYTCGVCERVFSKEGNLSRHLHTGHVQEKRQYQTVMKGIFS